MKGNMTEVVVVVVIVVVVMENNAGSSNGRSSSGGGRSSYSYNSSHKIMVVVTVSIHNLHFSRFFKIAFLSTFAVLLDGDAVSAHIHRARERYRLRGGWNIIYKPYIYSVCNLRMYVCTSRSAVRNSRMCCEIEDTRFCSST